MAVGEPPQRAPITMTSYVEVMGSSPSRSRLVTALIITLRIAVAGGRRRVTCESRSVTRIADALQPFVDAGEVTGLVAVLARGDDVEVTVLGDQAIGGSPMR